MITSARGAKIYTGKPCAEGHTEKYASSGNCVECARGRIRFWRLTNHELSLEKMRLYRTANRKRFNESCKRSNRKRRAAAALQSNHKESI